MAMHAEVGDDVVVRGRHVADGDRLGTILEVHGSNGEPPYLIRWKDGHQSLFTPSSDTLIEHHPRQRAR
jgi:Domain of unknown function (DUF1918)